MLLYISAWPYKWTKLQLPFTFNRFALRGIPLLISDVLDEGQKINYLHWLLIMNEEKEEESQ